MPKLAVKEIQLQMKQSDHTPCQQGCGGNRHADRLMVGL